MPRPIGVILLTLVICAITLAQPPAKDPDPTPDDLRAQWLKAASDSRFADAVVPLTAYIALRPDDLTARYNLIVIQIAAGDTPAAETALKDAVEWGWNDLERLERDPGLRPLRTTRTYRAIVENWRTVQDGILEGRHKRYLSEYGPKYRLQREEPLRVALVSPLPQGALDDALSEIRRVTRYWAESILPDGTPAVKADGDRPEPWMIILLPTEADYNRWAVKTYGERGQRIGGVYDHGKQELIAQDIGATLRHEYSHLLHWRHMERLGQVHPMWIQEGLCTLLEDVRLQPAEGDRPARLTPTPSWRTNTARRMQQGGNLPKWSALMKLGPDAFSEARALGNYAAARSIFLFLAEKGKLREWYADYTRTFAEDPSGAASIARVMGKPIEQVERDWKNWVRLLPEVAEAGKPIAVTLPFKVEAGADGLRVAGQPVALESPLARAGLRVGDIISELDGQPARDLQELARLLGDKKAGQEAQLTYRRGNTTFTTRVKLVGRK